MAPVAGLFEGARQAEGAGLRAFYIKTDAATRTPLMYIVADRRARRGPQAEDNTDPRDGALHAVQGLLASARLSVQAIPLSCPADPENFRE
jgi:hypothetical protein